jgi:hypothetical protein
MMKTWLAILLSAAFSCLAQTMSPDAMRANMPSNAEISELLSKADEKVARFEQTMRAEKPTLDGIDSSLTSKALDAASTAHTAIRGLQKAGPTGYGLVVLVVTLDDLSSNAFRSALLLTSEDHNRVATGGRPDNDLPSSVLALSNAGNACNDIAELIVHATLRLLSVEEALLNQLLDSKK